MRFSAASFLALVSMMTAPSPRGGFVLAEEETAAVAAAAAAEPLDVVVVAPLLVDSKDTVLSEDQDVLDKATSNHLFTLPIVFNFEFEGVLSDDSSALTQIEEALVMAGNEIFDPEFTKFYGIFAKDIMDETTEEEDDDDDDFEANRMGMTPAASPVRAPTVVMRKGTRGGAVVAAIANDGSAGEDKDPELSNCLLFMFNICTTPTRRPTRRPTPRPAPAPPSLHRLGWVAQMPYYCTLCAEPDYVRQEDLTLEQQDDKPPQAAARIQKPFMTANEEKEHILRWQKRTCRKIRKIKGFETAQKCFIYMDMDHSTPIDAVGDGGGGGDNSYVSTFWLKDEVQQQAEDVALLEIIPDAASAN